MKKRIIPVLLILSLAACDKMESGIGAFDMGDGYLNTGEKYTDYGENPFIKTTDEPTSTFSIDADGGSYSNVRRWIESGSLPPDGSVRVEEFINSFNYDYPEPTGNDPIGITTEVGACPWTPGHKLIQIGIKGKSIAKKDYPESNLVFLIDVSGSMSADDKLPLAQHGFNLLVDELRDIDHVAIVTYAGADKVVLKSTPGSEKKTIKKAIDKLTSGGGTAGAKGINTAYEIAEENFITDGNNRIIIVTDGDFNIGISSQDELIKLIEEKRETGIYLSVFGVGTGNYNESMMEQLADNGNGTYEYIDSKTQAQKVFVDDFGKFFTQAKDVKVQIEFDSTIVEQYRLIGYENRLMDSSDFTNDKKDAGEIGAGQTITAMYEIIPKRQILRGNHPFDVDFRYKLPDQDVSIPLRVTATDDFTSFNDCSENFRFASSVAAFGMLLYKSKYYGDATYDWIKTWAGGSVSFDPYGYKADFLKLVDKAKALDK